MTGISGTPGHGKYDWNAIQQDRNAGMSVKELSAKYGCSDVTVYHRTVPPTGKKSVPGERHKELERIKAVNWTAVQNDRTDGKLSGQEISKKYNISLSSMYKYTKPVRKTGSGTYPRKPKAPKAVLVTMNGTANAHELTRQALVAALGEREKLNKLIQHLETINS